MDKIGNYQVGETDVLIKLQEAMDKLEHITHRLKQGLKSKGEDTLRRIVLEVLTLMR